ncbi:potassium/proton antiporter [Lapillicoccus jejuensis]|uniref:Potassium/proton antiporter (CPA1 family) n=1 Tax=Lapillicoccus jejuensis TaxID=402171 RepID=A0A542E158_9MICO|nr:potassium/proton antiporter [Lapillicoccus jejuensis]TQJ09083.1 potassium/proton antiporter (CPA1 family) [Lapillicoccus jejuensis]
MTTTVFSLDDLTRSLLIGSVVLLVAVVAVRLSVRSGVPALLLFLAIGLGIGESGLGIRFDDDALTQVLGYAALVLILAEGGVTTRWSGVRRSVAPAAVLSTVGVVVSVGVVGVAAHYVLHLDWSVAFLVGAILSSTDAAAVFSVLRTVPLPRRLSGLLEAESGFNDAPVVILVVSLAGLTVPTAAHHPWWFLLLEAVGELVGGAAVGLLLGWGGASFLRRAAGASSGLFAIGVLATAVLAYAVADSVHTSGFIAAYLCALVLGNVDLPHRAAVHGFASALGTIAQIGLFVLLGLLASPSALLERVPTAIVIGLVLLLVARPLSVLVSLTPFRVPWRDQVFLSWAGLRGAVPVVLATVPTTVGTPGTGWVFDLVFVLVVIFTLLQAPTLPWLARRLDVAESVQQVALQVETTPLERMHADVVQVTVGEASRMHGVEVFELRLPRGATVTLVVRDGEALAPTPRTTLRRGDQLLIVTTAAARAATEARVRAVDRGGRLAGWA